MRVRSKKGVGGVVAVVALIGFSLVAIGIVATIVFPNIEETLVNSEDCLDSHKSLTLSGCYNKSGRGTFVSLERDDSDFDLSGLVFFVQNKNGDSQRCRLDGSGLTCDGFITGSAVRNILDPKGGSVLTGRAIDTGDPDLILYYDFEGVSGSSIPDVSGEGHTGTMFDDTTIVPVTIGKAARFDGDGDYISSPDADDLDLLGTPFTIAFAIKLDQSNTDTTFITKVDFSNAATKGGYHFLSNTLRYVITARAVSLAGITTPSLLIQTDWKHFAIVYDDVNEEVILYMDGNEELTRFVGGPSGGVMLPSTKELRIWLRTADGTSSPGLIDDVVIYRRALSPAEINGIVPSWILNCVNGAPNIGEECDDGNFDNNDACTNQCTNNVCGDGYRWIDGCVGAQCEACDDGNNIVGDGCDLSCGIEPGCDNGIVEAGEDCDDANSILTDLCDTYGTTPNSDGECTFTFCGDGIRQNINGMGGIETCDDGGNANNDGCDEFCILETCPDEVVDPDEECDDDNFVNEDICPTSCKWATCGDGYKWTDGCVGAECEECDDGNLEFDDTCDTVGDGPMSNGECSLTYCGDNVRQTPNGALVNEECDDGNTVSGVDGCSAVCTIESCSDVSGNSCTAGLEFCPGTLISVSDGMCCDVACELIPKCSDCEADAICDRTECDGITNGPVSSEICYYLGGSCNLCSGVTVCSDYGNDITTCGDDPCNINSCTWDIDGGRCIVRPAIFTANDIPGRGELRTYLVPDVSSNYVFATPLVGPDEKLILCKPLEAQLVACGV